MGKRSNRKRQKNTSGLRNQSSTQNLVRGVDSDSDTPDGQDESATGVLFDSNKLDFTIEELASEVDEASDWGELDDDDLAESLAWMAMEDDPDDHDWIPVKLRNKTKKQSS